MARKGWESLSPGYRSRIEKAGLTRADYEAGQPLQKARGHANTPERPTQFKAEKFPEYARERTRLAREVEHRKLQMFGGSPRWDKERSDRAMREKPPSLAQMRWALNATDEEILDAFREDPKTFEWLSYH